MKRLLAILVPVLVVGIIGTELAMDLTSADRLATYGIYAATAVLAIVLYLGALWASSRLRSLSTAVAWVGIAAVAVATLAVVMAAWSMFFSDHDRDVLLVVLGIGVGLSAALSYAIGKSAAADLDKIETAAAAVAAGDLSARAGVERRDELGDAARAFDEMVERLAAVEEERRILIASVGHDLRTPLASLRAAMEAVEDGVVEDTDAYRAGMAKDVEHLGRLVDDLFDYARIESGRFEPALESLDLRELADESVEVLTPLARACDVELVLSAGVAAPVEVDPAAMGRVFRNLVDNAIRHTPAGASVTVEVTPRGFRVVDEGPGFPAEFRDRAFDRFTRADPARTGEGSGLGLAIARGIVEAHGGSIWIEEGSGGRVVVEL